MSTSSLVADAGHRCILSADIVWRTRVRVSLRSLTILYVTYANLSGCKARPLPLKGHLELTRTICIFLSGIFILVPPLCAQLPVAKVVESANRFLALLTDGQRQKVMFAFDDEQQRARWSNFPTGMVPRAGINFREMTEPQRAAVLDLLGTVLSPMGLEKVNQIRMADDDFKVNGSRNGPGGRGRPGGNAGPPPGQNGPPGGKRGPGGGGGDLFGSDLYYISFLGKPSASAPWMLQFGGHHLALNITISGSNGVMTPSLTGAQPATFTANGKNVRPLGRESDKALALLRSLDDTQRKQAILTYRVPDLVLGPGQDGKKISPEGLKVSQMNERQRAMLLDVVAEWVDIMNTGSAAERLAQIKAELNETWFAWSGETDFRAGENITAYYRIQGPHLVIEYAPQNGDPTNHVHTIYRDPTNDYGRALAKR
ncbi:MAG: DUF3500 domain-containing protein [Acidobacteriaceae bacterium]|nr:DUF3500 domain-containing protein [Acidobacteriaceae bacterium]